MPISDRSDIDIALYWNIQQSIKASRNDRHICKFYNIFIVPSNSCTCDPNEGIVRQDQLSNISFKVAANNEHFGSRGWGYISLFILEQKTFSVLGMSYTIRSPENFGYASATVAFLFFVLVIILSDYLTEEETSSSRIFK